jgi:hypothetical protein
LEVEINGDRQRVERFRLPRQDVFERLGEGSPGSEHAFRSGFVAMPRLAPVEAAGEASVSLILSLDGGTEAVRPVGRLRLEPGL